MLECVVNISEGRDRAVIDAIAASAGTDLLDLHCDPHHHRSVLTLVGEGAARAVSREAVARLDLRHHHGVHPRIGVVDVVPFVPLPQAGTRTGTGSTMDDAVAARDRFGAWAAHELALPCFAYGPERSLPDVRRHGFADLAPDWGPGTAHPTAGAAAVGARPVMVAYNLWLAEPDLDLARRIAREVRGPAVRALGLAVGDQVQLSANLIDPQAVGPGDLADAVTERGGAVARGELVGLIPQWVLDAVPPERWGTLGLAADRTIEARLATRPEGPAGA